MRFAGKSFRSVMPKDSGAMWGTPVIARTMRLEILGKQAAEIRQKHPMAPVRRVATWN